MEKPQEQDLTRYLKLVYKKRFLFTAVTLGIMALAVAVSYVMPNVYEAKAVVLIERNFVNQLIKDITVTPSLEDRIHVLSLVIKSRSHLLKVIRVLDAGKSARSDEKTEGLVRHFQKKTEITVGVNRTNWQDMDSFTVSYEDRDPQAAMTYVNTLVRVYIEENLSAKRDEAYGASRFVSEQLSLVKDKMHAVEDQIALLKSSEAVTEIGGRSLQERLLALRKKLNDLLMTYTENHPEVIRVNNEISELQSLAKKERAGTIGAPHGNAPRLAEPDRKKVADLEREREAYKKIYEELIATLGKSEVSTQAELQAKAGTFRIIDPAILPTRPVGPNRSKIMLLGILAGIAGGFGLVMLLDALDGSVKTVDALKGFGAPVLAVIPSIRNTSELAQIRRNDLILYSVAAAAVVCVLSLVTVQLL